MSTLEFFGIVILSFGLGCVVADMFHASFVKLREKIRSRLS